MISRHPGVRRYLAYGMITVGLLIIYQIVFMARTSANRDWNHIHGQRFTLQDVQRFAVSDYQPDLLRGPVTPININSYFKRTDRTKPYRTVAAMFGSRNHEMTLSKYADLFVYPDDKSPGDERMFKYEDLYVVDSIGDSIDSLVQAALTAKAEAIMVVVDYQWTPNFGLVRPKIPIIPVITTKNELSRNSKISVHLNQEDRDYFATIEHEISGFTKDVVIVGDSIGSTISTMLFKKLAHTFTLLSQSGWQPYRSIRFVSFGAYSSESWAKKHAKYLANHGIAYIDCGTIPTDSNQRPAEDIFTMSPLLSELATWAADQIEASGITLRPLKSEKWPSAPLGADVFALQHGVPTVATDFMDLSVATKFLSLIIGTLAQDSILPTRVSGYTELLSQHEEKCPEVALKAHKALTSYDEYVAESCDEFSAEYPWYQFKAKFRAIIERKRANIFLQRFDSQITDRGKHAVFKSNADHTGTVVHGINCNAAARLVKYIDTHLS